MFRVIGGLVVYVFALYGLGKYFECLERGHPQRVAAEGSAS
jgi:hypothetical protein